MKKFIFYFLAFLFTTIGFSAFSQEFDTNWYILNKKGIDGNKLNEHSLLEIKPNIQSDIWHTEISTKFKITGISPPEDDGADHILAIFEDGSFYSNRIITEDLSAKITHENELNLQVASQNPLLFLKYTNFYDVDDLPEKVKVKNGAENPTFLKPINSAEALGNKYRPLLAHQSVVPYKDVAITFCTENLPGNKFIIRYNKVIKAEGVRAGQIINLELMENTTHMYLFKASKIFNEGSWVTPQIESRENMNETHIDFGSMINPSGNNGTTHPGSHGNGSISRPNFIHINIQADRFLGNFIPKKIGAKVSHYAVFELIDITNSTEKLVSRHVEPILNVRDPNEIVVAEFCQTERDVYWKGQFYNKTGIKASGLAAKIKFPISIDMSTLRLDIANTKISNIQATPHVSKENNEVLLTWTRSWSVQSNLNTETDSLEIEKVEFAFCGKANESYMQMYPRSLNFRPDNATAYFNYDTAHPIPTKMKIYDHTTKVYDHGPLDPHTVVDPRPINLNCHSCFSFLDFLLHRNEPFFIPMNETIINPRLHR